jgi:thiol-disulfide isomerase/thioredoxin
MPKPASRSRIPKSDRTNSASPAVAASVKLLFFSSSFCDPCIQTRSVLQQVSTLVPAATIAELDVAAHTDVAERAGIRSTPTVVVLDSADTEVFRAEGVPTVNQVLVALAKAV